MQIWCESPPCRNTRASRLNVSFIGKANYVNCVVHLHWFFEVHQGNIILVCSRYVRRMNIYCSSSYVLLGVFLSREIKLSGTYDPLKRLLEPVNVSTEFYPELCLLVSEIRTKLSNKKFDVRVINKLISSTCISSEQRKRDHQRYYVTILNGQDSHTEWVGRLLNLNNHRHFT